MAMSTRQEKGAFMAHSDTIPAKILEKDRAATSEQHALGDECATLWADRRKESFKPSPAQTEQELRLNPVTLADSHTEVTSMKGAKKGREFSPPAPPAGLIETVAASGGEPRRLVIARESSQRQLSLPEGWEEKERRAQPGFLYCEYQPPESPQTRLAYWNRGYGGVKLNREAAHNFKELLSQPAHELTAKETQSMYAVLANGVYDNDGCFDIGHGALRTIELTDGSRALLLEANWQDTGKSSYGIFADFDGSGQYVEQVYLIAPNNDYGSQLARVKDCIHSLKWK